MAGETLTAKIEGGPELIARLKQLGGPQLERVGVEALRAGGAAFRDAARERAPVLKEPDPRRTAGTLKRSIRVARARRGGESEFEVVVGVRKSTARARRAFRAASRTFDAFRAAGNRFRGATENPNDPYYWRWVELPTKRATLRAQPFLRPAFDAAREDATQRVLDRLNKRLTKLGV